MGPDANELPGQRLKPRPCFFFFLNSVSPLISARLFYSLASFFLGDGVEKSCQVYKKKKKSRMNRHERQLVIPLQLLLSKEEGRRHSYAEIQ